MHVLASLVAVTVLELANKMIHRGTANSKQLASGKNLVVLGMMKTHQKHEAVLKRAAASPNWISFSNCFLLKLFIYLRQSWTGEIWVAPLGLFFYVVRVAIHSGLWWIVLREPPPWHHSSMNHFINHYRQCVLQMGCTQKLWIVVSEKET